MPLFAKILAALNVLAAGAFIAIASVDWQLRQEWSWMVFRTELELSGLPLDEQDTGWRHDPPLVRDLSDELLEKHYGAEKGKLPAARTQAEEIERAKKAVLADIARYPQEEDQKDLLREILLAHATTFDERRRLKETEFPRYELADLKGKVESLFDDAVAGDAKSRRKKSAHLLCTLGRLPFDQDRPTYLDLGRVEKVVGLGALAREVGVQADNLREMIHRTGIDMVNERTVFEMDYQRLTDRILYLANRLEGQRIHHEGLVSFRERQASLVADRQAKIDELKETFQKALADTHAALKLQNALEKELFETHRQNGGILKKNLELEETIRALELRWSTSGQETYLGEPDRRTKR